MTLDEYFEKYNISKFEDDPHLFGISPKLSELVDYECAEIDLKIHLAKVILCRNFDFSGSIFGEDARIFIKSFFEEYDNDLLKPWITMTIKEAASMVLSDETFTKKIIGTTFLFGVIEFYAKYSIGYRPNEVDFFDDYHMPFRRMSLEKALNITKELDKEIAISIKDVDSYSKNRLIELAWNETRWNRANIADRLTLARNTMLHGENHAFYGIGQYLLVLYALFHLQQLKETSNNS